MPRRKLGVIPACGLLVFLTATHAPADMEAKSDMMSGMTDMTSMSEESGMKGMLDAEEGPNDWLVKHPTILRLLELHNETRARAGMPELTLNTEMCLKAQKHAQWMASTGAFAHSGLPYRENIAYSQLTPESAVRTWTYSPPHYNNLLRGHEAGFGYMVRNGRTYWVAVFR